MVEVKIWPKQSCGTDCRVEYIGWKRVSRYKVFSEQCPPYGSKTAGGIAVEFHKCSLIRLCPVSNFDLLWPSLRKK